MKSAAARGCSTVRNTWIVLNRPRSQLRGAASFNSQFAALMQQIARADGGEVLSANRELCRTLA